MKASTRASVEDEECRIAEAAAARCLLYAYLMIAGSAAVADSSPCVRAGKRSGAVLKRSGSNLRSHAYLLPVPCTNHTQSQARRREVSRGGEKLVDTHICQLWTSLTGDASGWSPTGGAVEHGRGGQGGLEWASEDWRELSKGQRENQRGMYRTKRGSDGGGPPGIAEGW